MNCGVPQDSALGPLLFLKYVDAMCFYLLHAVVTSFADDTALTVMAKYIEELIEITNIILENLSQLTKPSFLAMNIEKTNYVICHISKVVNNCHSILLHGPVVRFFNVDIQDLISM